MRQAPASPVDRQKPAPRRELTPTIPVAGGSRSAGAAADRMSTKLAEEIRTKGGVVRRARTVEEALRLIDHDLPVELRNLPRWTFARALLLEVQRTGTKRDMKNAVRQLKQALSNEDWLDT
jgi:hypothetical protein